MSQEETGPRGAVGPSRPVGEGGLAAGKREPAWVTFALLAAVALFLILVRHVLTPFIIAAILAYVSGPVVVWIENRARAPRPAAVLLFLFLVFGPLGAIIWAVEPVLVAETKDLAANAPDILRSLLVQVFGGESFSFDGQTVDADTIAAYLLGALLDVLGTPAEAFHVVANVAEFLLDSFLTLVLLFYFLLNPRPFATAALRLIPIYSRPYWRRAGHEINQVLARYVRGVLFLVLLMAVVTWIGLTLIFRLPYALPIAISTGFLEIIPFLGPVLAASVAAVVALAHGGVSYAAGIAIFYLIIRQLEDQLVMPMVIGRVVELHPAVAIFAVLAGASVGGVLGALLAIPIAAALKVAFDLWHPE